MVSGPVLVKIKGTNWNFICLGPKKRKNGRNEENGQILVSGALDDTKTIGKVGADIFAKSGPEKSKKTSEQIKIFSGIFPVFPVELAKNP